MDNLPKISVPVPCHENWNGMSEAADGRFCVSCSKNVIDFSQKSPQEIHSFLNQHKGKEICGRFRNDQIQGLKILIPEKVFYRKMSFYRAFVLALFTTMGSILFSCSNDDGARQNIDSVEIVSDEGMSFTAGMVWIPEYYVPEESEAEHYQPLFYEDAADYDWDADTTAYSVDSVAVQDVTFENELDSLGRPESDK